MLKEKCQIFETWRKQMTPSNWNVMGIEKQNYLIETMLSELKSAMQCRKNYDEKNSCHFIQGWWKYYMECFILTCGIKWNLLNSHGDNFFSFIFNFYSRNTNYSKPIISQLKRNITQCFQHKTMQAMSVIAMILYECNNPIFNLSQNQCHSKFDYTELDYKS